MIHVLPLFLTAWIALCSPRPPGDRRSSSKACLSTLSLRIRDFRWLTGSPANSQYSRIELFFYGMRKLWMQYPGLFGIATDRAETVALTKSGFGFSFSLFGNTSAG